MNDVTAMRAWIDSADYETLLHKWRYAPAGDPYFIGDIGEYYSKVIREKKAELPEGKAAAISKKLG